MFYGCVENVFRSIDQCHLPEHHGCEVRNERGIKKKPCARRIISQETFFFFFFFFENNTFYWLCVCASHHPISPYSHGLSFFKHCLEKLRNN